MRLVILESPYAGDIEKNVSYARACLRDSLMRGEAPIASHLLYTQPGVLDDDISAERQHGIDAGLAWRAVAEASVVYVDLGISKGMHYGIAAAFEAGRPIEMRTLHGWTVPEQSMPVARAAHEKEQAMTPEQIEHMISRFLSWKLPDDFNPDGGVIFAKTIHFCSTHEHTFNPVGTNLLTATQAEVMVRHMLEGLPVSEQIIPTNDFLANSRKAEESVNAGLCSYWTCFNERGEAPMRFVVCKACGNKRCPKCSDHRFKCTGSNEPGQVGEPELAMPLTGEAS